MSNVVPFPGMKPEALTTQNVTSKEGRNAARLKALANLEAMNRAQLEHQCMRQDEESMPCRQKTT